MRINFRIIWLALPLVFGACSDSSDADTRPAAETISVSVGSGPKIDIESEDKSRTQLGEGYTETVELDVELNDEATE